MNGRLLKNIIKICSRIGRILEEEKKKKKKKKNINNQKCRIVIEE